MKSYDDIKGFIRERRVDSVEMAKILNCSRQYVKQLVDKESYVIIIGRAAYTNTYRPCFVVGFMVIPGDSDNESDRCFIYKYK